MVESGFQVVGAPLSVEPSHECPRGRKVGADMDRRRRRREVRLAQISRHVLKMRISVRAAIEPCVSETGRIRGVLASRRDGIARESRKGGNKRREGLGLPAHPVTPFLAQRSRRAKSPPSSLSSRAHGRRVCLPHPQATGNWYRTSTRNAAQTEFIVGEAVVLLAIGEFPAYLAHTSESADRRASSSGFRERLR